MGGGGGSGVRISALPGRPFVALWLARFHSLALRTAIGPTGKGGLAACLADWLSGRQGTAGLGSFQSAPLKSEPKVCAGVEEFSSSSVGCFDDRQVSFAYARFIYSVFIFLA